MIYEYCLLHIHYTFFLFFLARKSAVYTKRNSNESILGSSNNNNDKENNKPISREISHPAPSVFKSKFVEKDQINPDITTTTETKKSSKQVIESPITEIKTTSAILAPPVGSAPVPVPKPVPISSTRVQPSVQPSVQPEQSTVNTVEATVIKPQDAVLAVSAVRAASPVKAASPVTANSFTTPGGWNTAVVKTPLTQLQTTEKSKSKTELTLEERVSTLSGFV